MAETIREQILVAVETLVAGLLGVTAERNRDTAVTKFPSVIVLDGPQEEPTYLSGLISYLMVFQLEMYAAGATGKAAGSALNALYGAVVVALTADPTLGGLVVDMTEGPFEEIEIGQAAGQGATIAGNLQWITTYWTPVGDPFTVAPV